MNNPNEYYKATVNKQPSGLIRKFFNFKYNEKMIGNIAIDLGCGAGNDTEFLISKGFHVTAIDKEEQDLELMLDFVDDENTKYSI